MFLPVSSSADPSTSSTSSLNEGSTSSATIVLSSEESKIKRRRIKLYILNIYKSFNLDKTKVSIWMENKNSIIQAASE